MPSSTPVDTLLTTGRGPSSLRSIYLDGGHRGADPFGTSVHEPWTRDAVKDILRRGRFYLGYVVEKRGLDERPGRHEAIIDEATYNAALIGDGGGSDPESAPRRTACTSPRV